MTNTFSDYFFLLKDLSNRFSILPSIIQSNKAYIIILIANQVRQL